jgi:23S rRNA (cytidine1920-2'-O)/16S rRNA (cytidine1409-2'-O)-methyltransferase
VVLVKPQFEVGRGQVGRGGIVREPALHRDAVMRVAHAAQSEMGYRVRAICPSPITGAEGNREFFLHLARSGATADDEALAAMVDAAVTP